MADLGMDVAGIHTQHLTCSLSQLYLCLSFLGECTNGEWNTLRCRGNTRPLSIFQIRADVRAKYSRMPYKTMMAMLTPICK